MTQHPRPRLFRAGDVRPNVHWAQIQRHPPFPGKYRSICDFELIYVAEGTIRAHIADGRDALLVEAGDLLLLPPAVAHRIEILTEPHTVMLGIHFDFFDELPELAEQDIIVRDPDAPDARICSMPAHEDGQPVFRLLYRSIPIEMREWMERIVGEHARRGPSGDLSCRGLMLMLFSLLLRLNAKLDRDLTGSEYGEPIMQLTAEIQQHPGEAWSNPAMASRFNMSEDHFVRLFKDAVGMSPHKYVQAIRHREAKRLLSQTDMKIELIGRRLGYDDLHYFSKAFKKWQGIPPSAYRKLSLMH